MTLCDNFREEISELGIRVKDSGEDSKWSWEDKELLKKEKDEKIANEKKKEEAKQKANEQKLQKEKEKLEKSKVNPCEMFRTEE